MSSLKAVKNKINSVKSTKKIFSVMQLIATSKMKKAQDAFNSSNEVIKKIQYLIKKNKNYNNYLLNHSNQNKSDAQTNLYIFFCSDRGLCGNYNSIIWREMQKLTSQNNKNIKIILIGNKLRNVLRKQNTNIIDENLSGKFDEYIKNEDRILNLLERVFAMKESGEITDCKVVYIFSKNAMSKEVRKIDLFETADLDSGASSGEQDDSEEDGIIYEDSKKNAINYLMKFYLKIKFFNIFKSAYFSELSSRMVAMDNASKNAQKIQDQLTLFYNKKRQANITNDLIDIINGAENL